jgi:hypothetical protein
MLGFPCIPSEPLVLSWQLESHPELYAGYVPMDYREYLNKMSKWVFSLILIYTRCLVYTLNTCPHFVMHK